MLTTVLHIFTFHDHFFKISRWSDTESMKTMLEDEYGTTAEFEDVTDLKALREACATMLQGYREEMQMPEVQS